MWNWTNLKFVFLARKQYWNCVQTSIECKISIQKRLQSHNHLGQQHSGKDSRLRSHYWKNTSVTEFLGSIQQATQRWKCEWHAATTNSIRWEFICHKTSLTQFLQWLWKHHGWLRWRSETEEPIWGDLVIILMEHEMDAPKSAISSQNYGRITSHCTKLSWKGWYGWRRTRPICAREHL